MQEDLLTKKIIKAAIEVHKELGPGLLENSYEMCLLFELKSAGLSVQNQKALPVKYKNVLIDCGYRIDLIVEDKVIIELKVVESLNSLHTAQILTYMKLSGIEIGLLINFNEKLLYRGIKRLVLSKQ